MPSHCAPLLFPLSILPLLLFVAQGLVCRKEKVSPVGMNFGTMNVECGQYVQHCLKAFRTVGRTKGKEFYSAHVGWDNLSQNRQRDCDPLAFCPPDGSKVIKNAEYFCCAGNVCNGKEDGKRRQSHHFFIILLIIFIGQIL